MAGPQAGRRNLRRFVPLLALPLIALGLWLAHGELARFSYADLLRYLRLFPGWKLAAALVLTAGGYLALIGYDVLAFRYVGRELPFRRVALAGFIGYAFSNNVNSLASGIPLRFRLYSAWGVPPGEMVRVLAFTVSGFWLGFLSLAGLSFALFPRAVPAELRLPLVNDRPLGIAFLVLVGAYLAANALARPSLEIWRWRLSLPGPGWSLAQFGLASLDWSCAAAVLFVALPPHPELGFPGFLGLFLLAQILGLLSQSPGGLGVFDTAMVLLLSPSLPAVEVLGALLIYRAIYYLLPLTLAAILLAGFEIFERRERIGAVAARVGRWTPPVVPRVMAFLTFLAGAVLLASGATPAVGSRLGWLNDILPLPVIEVSHFLGSLAGVALLLLAHGLQRRLDAAFHLAVVLLALGITASLLKGADWEEALLLGVMLAALVSSRREFYRKTSLLRETFTPGWWAATVAVVLAAGWLGELAHRHVEYSNQLWWQFELRGDAPRALRAAAGTVIALFVFGFMRLLRISPPEPAAPTAADLDAAEAVALSSPRSYAYLALLGDKRLLFNEPGTAFVMYAVEGRSWIAMGDPVGPEDQAKEVGWRFQEICQRHGGWPVFYEVGEGALSLYIEMGLSLLKIGEEARVPLEGFSLAGPRRAELRQALRRADREGAAFEIVERRRVPSAIPELARVSEAWLLDKKGAEKGFSLGYFDPEYLCRCPLAVVRREGRIVAFANLWPAGEREELSIDLMRYDPASAPHGVMDFLFASLLTWGQSESYRWFNLGMAPLAGLDERREGPLWHRVGAFVFHHGENFYNFEGLRRFKQKFEPVWEPRYLAAPAGLALPRVLADLVSLIGGERQGS